MYLLLRILIILTQNCIVQYQSEIELLKKALADKSKEVSRNYERQVELEENLLVCEDKFSRLYKSHRKILSNNQNLEEKLLKLVDRNSGEKAQLIGDCATLNLRLSQANINILQLQREIVSHSFYSLFGGGKEKLICNQFSFL